MKKVTWLFVIFTIILAPLFCSVSMDADEASRDDGLSIHWSPYRLLILNNETGISELVVKYSGPPMTVNITFTCPKIIACPVERLDIINVTHLTTFYYNLSITPALEWIDLSNNIEIRATVENETYSIKNNAPLFLYITLPISAHLMDPFSLRYPSSHFENGTIKENEPYQGDICTKIDNELPFLITNHDPEKYLSGYFSASVTIQGINGHGKYDSRTNRYVNEGNVTILPSSEKILN